MLRIPWSVNLNRLMYVAMMPSSVNSFAPSAACKIHRANEHARGGAMRATAYGRVTGDVRCAVFRLPASGPTALKWDLAKAAGLGGLHDASSNRILLAKLGSPRRRPPTGYSRTSLEVDGRDS